MLCKWGNGGSEGGFWWRTSLHQHAASSTSRERQPKHWVFSSPNPSCVFPCSGRQLQAGTDAALSASASSQATLGELPGRRGWLKGGKNGLRSPSSCLEPAAGLEKQQKTTPGGWELFLQGKTSPVGMCGERHLQWGCLGNGVHGVCCEETGSASQSPTPWEEALLGTPGRKTLQRQDGTKRAAIRDPKP